MNTKNVVNTKQASLVDYYNQRNSYSLEYVDLQLPSLQENNVKLLIKDLLDFKMINQAKITPYRYLKKTNCSTTISNYTCEKCLQVPLALPAILHFNVLASFTEERLHRKILI